MRPTIKLVIAAAFGGLLAACSTADIENLSVTGGGFEKGLYEGYLALAKEEYGEDDWSDGSAFAERARASAGGKPPQPEAIAARKLPSRSVGELAGARSSLVSALSKGAATKVPAAAAKAQVMFDCWMQEQEEDLQPDHIAKCRAGFVAAMKQVDAALAPKQMAAKKPAPKPAPRRPAQNRPPQVTKYVVYFDLNSAKLDNTAMAVVDIVKGDFKKGVSVYVAGYTDRAGNKAYNRKLAKTRADVVTDALVKAGVSKGAIGTTVHGEDNNAVSTKDGIAERLNRRVEISLLR